MKNSQPIVGFVLPWVRGAVVALLVLSGAVAMRKYLLSGLEGRIVWVTFYPAVMVASMMAGWAAGLASALGACVIALYAWPFFVTHPFIKDSGDWLGLYAFLFNCVLISWVAQRMRDAQKRALEAKKQAEEAKARADAASLAKGQFLANMSHEIRTPMNAVLGFSRLLERDPSLSEDARGKVAVIQKSGEHLLGIINDVLEMARIESGKMELRPSSIDLHDLLHDMAMLFRQRAQEKGLEFKMELDLGLPRYVESDLGKLRQILFNLLGNAVKFTKQGSVVLSARAVGDDRLVIEIGDTGIGIAPDQLERIFRAFERTREGEQHAGGSGLGLAICRQYADLMGGSLQVQSTVGCGSRFQFVFPAPLSSRGTESSAIQGRPKLAPGKSAKRILVVDDLPANRELLRAVFEPMGFEVNEAAGGETAIASVKNCRPDLVFMDMFMPGMDGIEATMRLREIFAKEKMAIVGISASAFKEEQERFLSAGLDAFLPKPFVESELIAILAKFFELEYEINPNESPGLERMSEDWVIRLQSALRQGSVRKIAVLGEEAKDVDPALAAWIGKYAARYDMDALTRLVGGINVETENV